MKFGVSLPLGKIHPKGEFQSGGAVREIARAIEAAGIDSCNISEHPAPDSHWLHNDPTGHDCLDPFTALSFVAAATEKLVVITNILVLPYRNPFVTAKAAASLQVLSDGRFVLGVGVGYQETEFKALGASFAARGRATDEALETIRAAWAGGPVTARGMSFEAVDVEPRPAPEPAPPIWIGGGSDKAVERAARLGDGWIPYFSVPTNDPAIMRASVVSMAHFAEKVARLKTMRAELGRTTPFTFAPRLPMMPARMDRTEAEQMREVAEQLQENGADWTWTPIAAKTRAAYLDAVAWYGEEVVRPMQKRTASS